MVLRIPDYYNKFRCIGSPCKHNCCIGWGVDIDDKSFEKYSTAEGSFGKRLRASMTEEDGYHTFIMNGERCPFLNGNNLCDIFINMGEGALCSVCTEYPRFGTQYGNLLEKGLGLSCEEAGKIIFSHEERVTFVESEYDGEEEKTDDELLGALFKSRDTIIKILQNRDESISRRMRQALSYSKEVQEHINMNELQKISADFVPYDGTADKPEYKTADMILEFMGTLEPMEDDWQDIINGIRAAFGNKEEYAEKLHALGECGREYILEQVAVYFIYRYYLNAMYDYNAYSKVRFAAVCLIVLRAMLAAKGNAEPCTAAEVARCFGANIEHSVANMESIYDEIQFNEEWNIEAAI